MQWTVPNIQVLPNPPPKQRPLSVAWQHWEESWHSSWASSLWPCPTGGSTHLLGHHIIHRVIKFLQLPFIFWQHYNLNHSTLMGHLHSFVALKACFPSFQGLSTIFLNEFLHSWSNKTNKIEGLRELFFPHSLSSRQKGAHNDRLLHLLQSLGQALGPASLHTPSKKNEKRESKEGESERGKDQKQRRAL